MTIIRKTKTVKLLLDRFDQTDDAISIVELVSHFNGVMDKSTVYRILDRLENSEILHSFMGIDGLKRYAKWKHTNTSIDSIKIHPHFLCNKCGKSSCLPIKISIPTIPNYMIESAEQILSGKCEKCLP